MPMHGANTPSPLKKQIQVSYQIPWDWDRMQPAMMWQERAISVKLDPSMAEAFKETCLLGEIPYSGNPALR